MTDAMDKIKTTSEILRTVPKGLSLTLGVCI